VSQACSDAIATGITTADNHDPFAFGGDEFAVGVVAIQEASGVGREEFHSEVNTAEGATGDRQIAGFGRTGGQQDSVVFCDEFFWIDILTDIGTCDELDTFGGHEIEASLDDTFVEFHVGDSIGQESTDPVGAFVDRHVVSCLVQLVGSGQAGRSTSDDGDFFPAANFGWFGHDPAFFEAAVDDRAFDILDRHRWVRDP